MSRKCSSGMLTWRVSASARVEPASRTASSLSSPARRSIASAIRSMTAARSRGLKFGHGPSSKARRAAATARSTSPAVPSGTAPMTSSVAGLSTVRTASPSLSCHAPSM